MEEKEIKNPAKGMKVVRSTSPNFSKADDFIVLKGKVFAIQHVGLKKIILRLKGPIKPETPLPDGIFCLEKV